MLDFFIEILLQVFIIIQIVSDFVFPVSMQNFIEYRCSSAKIAISEER
jgi:hypothetical protein